MRHELIRRRARLVDELIDRLRSARRFKNFPHKRVRRIVEAVFPRARFLAGGAYKKAYWVPSRARDLAIKVGDSRHIRVDLKAYKRIARTKRNRYFAKIYWTTRYCLLQKYGEKRSVPPDVQSRLKRVAKRYGLTDAKKDNIRFVDRQFKLVDVNLSRRRR